jgi:hypothetical protein
MLGSQHRQRKIFSSQQDAIIIAKSDIALLDDIGLEDDIPNDVLDSAEDRQKDFLPAVKSGNKSASLITGSFTRASNATRQSYKSQISSF